MVGTDKSKEEKQSDTIIIGLNTNVIIDANQESKSSSPPSPTSPPTHERNGSHGMTSTATTKVAAHTTISVEEKSTTQSRISTANTTDPNFRMNAKEERNLDELVQFIDSIMAESVVGKASTEKEQPAPETETVHAESSPEITSDVRPEIQFERERQADEAYCDIADDNLTLTEETGVDFYFNKDLDDIVVSMVDDVSVSISVALSGILSSNTARDNEEPGENEGIAKIPDQKEWGKPRVVDEDADAFMATEIEASRGIHHDPFGNTEIFHLEPSETPFQLSYVNGNTELILVRQKNEGKFFYFPIAKGIGSAKMIGDRLMRSTRSSKRDGLASTSPPLPQASSEGQTSPPPLDDISSTGSETTDDESMTSETSEEDGEDFQEDVQVLLKSLRSDISAMSRDIIFPNKENGHEGGDNLVKDEPSVSKAFTDIIMQVNRDAYGGLLALCTDAMNPQGSSGTTPSPTTAANVQKEEKVPEVPAKLRSTIQLVASDLTDASAYSADLFSRD